MRRSYIVALAIAVLFAVVALGVPTVSNVFAASKTSCGPALSEEQVTALQTGHDKFTKLHYAEQLAFVIKHIDTFKTAKGRTPAQVVALDTIIAKFHPQTFNGAAAKPKRMAMLAEFKKLKALQLFTDAEWKEMSRPDYATLAVGVVQVKRSQRYCECTAGSSTWCAPGCAYATSCDYWPWGCDVALLNECNGSCY